MKTKLVGTIYICGTNHYVGDSDCAECYGEPKTCTCGGLIHQEYVDESWDSVQIQEFCDQCGSDYEQV